ncbi:MAG: malto-oligosyltrehalose trehalohydrolase [Nevskia sp.]|nr:malto-oligosyltrehalose trehalohydrolase [Nevskia sp.]
MSPFAARAGFAQPLPFGATLLEDGRTRFRLWAPAQQTVALEVEGLAPQAMLPSEDGWFEVDAGCGAGARYRYRLATDLVVPDPASRFQPDDVHGPSLVVDPHAYQWQHPQWCGQPWTEAVIYELHVGACGGYAGVVARLPALLDLGITAIELMPIADFPGARNWGYDAVLPFAPDSAYGTPAQLKALIDAAHGLGLMIYLDVVYNHFGPDGNYLQAYAPQFFDPALQTPWGAAIDFQRREVREFFTQNALYWLREYRFDGLRFDAVHAICDPAWLDEMAEAVRGVIAAESAGHRHVHLVLENERNAADHLQGAAADKFNAQWNDDGHNVLHVLLTGETESYYANYADAPAEKLARVLAEGFAYQGEPMPSHDNRVRGTPSAHLPPSAFVLFLQNHDQIGNRAFGERLTHLADPQALRAATALQLLCPQIPLLFMGEEWGSRAPFLFFTDFHDALADAVREGRRKEFAAFAAFADAKSRARIPDPNAERTFLRSQADPAVASQAVRIKTYAEYRELLRLRRQHIAPRIAGSSSLGASAVGAAAVIASWLLADGMRLTIATNLGADALDFAADQFVFGACSIYQTGAGAALAARAGQLPAQSTCVFIDEVPGRSRDEVSHMQPGASPGRTREQPA